MSDSALMPVDLEERRTWLRSCWTDRRRLAEILLAADRVELTRVLNVIADGEEARASSAASAEPDAGVAAAEAGRETARLAVLAAAIAETAKSLGAPALRRDAQRLADQAASAAAGSREAEGAMLAVGLRVIDRILAARTSRSSSASPSGASGAS